ncbi:MAG: hypothetical protein IPO09_12185 [Anaeromyxobacter sp.]|nr:hypothetical protein [Anaeromyxobacter sp.]MBL0276340.1 hypothetical protein [Anaeromyxobacter sp.]
MSRPPPSPRPVRPAARPRAADLVVFLGPSLPAAEARRLAPCRVLPPARAGDLFAVLPERPLAIALVDGVFEAAPSVWHHELLAAQAAGVQVFGGASMGALRAAELAPYGVVGVGRIFGWYRDGVLADDADVALLHAGREQRWRPLSVPLVDVRAAALAAVAGGLCTGREGRRLVAAAAALFYQGRTWPAVLAATRLPAAARRRLAAWLPRAPSQKAEDARATVAAAAAFAAARRAGAPAPPPVALPPLPSHARRLRLATARSVRPDGRGVPSGRVLRALSRRPDADRLAAQGLRRGLLAALARSLGVAVDAAARAEAERRWLSPLGVAPAERAGFLAACGLDEGAAGRLVEDLALEAALLEAAGTVLPDGPGRLEGLALGARLTGAWVEALGGSPPAAARRRPRAGPGRRG